MSRHTPPDTTPPSSARPAPRTLDELFSSVNMASMVQQLQNGFASRSSRSSLGSGPFLTPPRTPQHHQNNGTANGGGHRGRSAKNRSEFQFWPQAMAMGSLLGKQRKKFQQVSYMIRREVFLS
jgi:hypothetical protein